MPARRRPEFGARGSRGQSQSSQEYHRRLHAALERQARSIGEFFHDEAAQLLTAAYIALDEASHDLPFPASERLLTVKGHLVAVEEHLRHVAHELHPRLLKERGFTAAIEFLARGFTARHGIPAEVRVRIPHRLPELVATALYRVAQEGLTNVGRHAQATQVDILVSPIPGRVRCVIRDNGIGFDVHAIAQRGAPRLGLRGIRERLEAVGGVLTIKSAFGAGTELIATIPWDG